LSRPTQFSWRDSLLLCVALLALAACRQTSSDTGSLPPTTASSTTEDTVTVPPGSVLNNTIRWAASKEEVISGYDIFRGDKAEGPFFRITETPIPKDPSSADSGVYSWIDITIVANQPYWYYVEGVTKEGKRAPITPIQKAPAKVHSDRAAIKE
jgi:hypothetical protein